MTERRSAVPRVRNIPVVATVKSLRTARMESCPPQSHLIFLWGWSPDFRHPWRSCQRGEVEGLCSIGRPSRSRADTTRIDIVTLSSTISSSGPRIIIDGDLVGSYGIAGSPHLLRCDTAHDIPPIGSDGLSWGSKTVLGISRSPSSAFEPFFSALVALVIWGRDPGSVPQPDILGGPHGAQIPTNYNPPLRISRGTPSSNPTSTTSLSPEFIASPHRVRCYGSPLSAG